MDPRGIPYLTLGPEGQPIARFQDGSYDALPTAAPALLAPGQEGVPNASRTAQGRSSPDQQAQLFLAATQGTNGLEGAAGGGGSPRAQQSQFASGGGAQPGSQGGRDGGGYDWDLPVAPPIVAPGGAGFGQGFGQGFGAGYAGEPANGRGDNRGEGFPGDPGAAMGDAGGSAHRYDRPVLQAGAGLAQSHDWGGQVSSGGGGAPSLDDARSRLAAARGRIQSALGGGSSSYSSDYSSSYSSDYKDPKVERPKPVNTHYGKVDESQAMGLTLHPTALLPRVFKGFNPSSPEYTTLSTMPVGAWATLLGKGTARSTVNTIGSIYKRAGMHDVIPSTDRLLRGFTRGKGVTTMFEGEKAKKGDYESSISPGYAYGKEPLPLGEATSSAGALLDAALWGLPETTRLKYGSQPGGWGAYQIDKWAGKALKKPAGKTKPITRYVGRHLFR